MLESKKRAKGILEIKIPKEKSKLATRFLSWLPG
jgi:hypothetical protein